MSGNDMLMLDLLVDIDQFELGSKVGYRYCVTLQAATDKRTGTPVIMEKISTPKNDPVTQQLLMREIMFLRERHPLIVELVGFGITARGPNPKFFLVLKPAPYLTLHDALTREAQGTAIDGWDATSKSKCVFGIAAAMCVVHSRNVVHSNLTPEAVQLDEHLEPVLGGFDFRERDPCATMALGNVLFEAPEVRSNNVYESEADVFAFAVVLYRFFTELVALDDDRPETRSLAGFMMRVALGARFARVEGIPDFYWDLITHCWDEEPGNRPSFQDIVRLLHENTEEYIFPGADLDAVKEYESRIISTLPHWQ